jgi:hypothetical protein
MTLIQELAKQNRLAALLYKNKIALMKHRGQLDFPDPAPYDVKYVTHLIDSFDWYKTPQGYQFWGDIYYSLNP